MTYVVTYLKSLLGWGNIESPIKRHRLDDDVLFSDGAPPYKIFKYPESNNFGNNMSSEEEREEIVRPNMSKVRYIPIQVEGGHASTSTPQPSRRFINLVEDDDEQPRRSPQPKLRIRNSEVVNWNNKVINKSPKYYIKIDDDDESDKDDVIFVEKRELHPVRATDFFQDQVCESPPLSNGSPSYMKFNRSLRNRTSKVASSNKINSRFKPAGITKSYKKEPVQIPKWLQPNSTSRNQKMLLLNGSSGSIMHDIFNFEAKKMYQEMIRESSGKPVKYKNNTSFNQKVRNSKRNFSINNKFSDSKISISSDSDIEIVTSETSTRSSIKIDPVNSLKDSFKEIAITTDDWLDDFKSRHSQKNEEVQEHLSLALEESDIVTKLQKENCKALSKYNLKNVLQLPVCLVPEPEPELQLPTLSEEQEMLVDSALGNGRPDDVFIEKFNLRISRRDIRTLGGMSWLNDEVINFYMNLLMQRSQGNAKLPKVYATNTFFYPKLMQAGQAGLRRWTRKVDIFSHDLMIVPVHLGVHWCVAFVRFKDQVVEYLDSMGGHNHQAQEALLQYLRDEHQDKHGSPLQGKWSTKSLSSDIPQQMNGSDCGMFCCTFAEFASRDAPFLFTQSHMPYLRRKVVCEILQGKLMM